MLIGQLLKREMACTSGQKDKKQRQESFHNIIPLKQFHLKGRLKHKQSQVGGNKKQEKNASRKKFIFFDFSLYFIKNRISIDLLFVDNNI